MDVGSRNLLNKTCSLLNYNLPTATRLCAHSELFHVIRDRDYCFHDLADSTVFFKIFHLMRYFLLTPLHLFNVFSLKNNSAPRNLIEYLKIIMFPVCDIV